MKNLRLAPAGLARDLHPPHQAGPQAAEHPDPLHRLRPARRLRHRLRPRLRRALPQPALHRGPGAGGGGRAAASSVAFGPSPTRSPGCARPASWGSSTSPPTRSGAAAGADRTRRGRSARLRGDGRRRRRDLRRGRREHAARRRPGAAGRAARAGSPGVLDALRAAPRRRSPLSIDTSLGARGRGGARRGRRAGQRRHRRPRRPGLLPLVAERGAAVCLVHMRGDAAHDAGATRATATWWPRCATTWPRGCRRRSTPACPRSGCSSTRASASARRWSTTSRCSAGVPALAALGRPVLVGVVAQGHVRHAARPRGGRADGRRRSAPGLAAVARGAAVLRVHDVRETADALRVWARGGGGGGAMSDERSRSRIRGPRGLRPPRRLRARARAGAALRGRPRHRAVRRALGRSTDDLADTVDYAALADGRRRDRRRPAGARCWSAWRA